MIIATDFTRDDCKVGNKRRSYDRLCREWRCSLCGGRLGPKWDESKPANWHVCCLICGSHDFIHEYEVERQRHDVLEVLADLPPGLAALIS